MSPVRGSVTIIGFSPPISPWTNTNKYQMDEEDFIIRVGRYVCIRPVLYFLFIPSPTIKVKTNYISPPLSIRQIKRWKIDNEIRE